MYPIIYKFGPYEIFGIELGPVFIYTYGLFVALGFLSAIYFALMLAKQEGIKEDKILDLCLWILIFSIAGARLFYVLINFSYYTENIFEVIQIYKGGLVFYGGLIGGILVSIWFSKKHNINIWKLADILAPGIVLGQGFGRIGCFFRGCCYGKETDMPWGITFPNDSLASYFYGNNHIIHPSQIYSSLINLSIFGFLFFYYRRKKFNGEIFILYLILYAVGRFFTESLRGDMERGFVGLISTSQTISAIFLIAGVAIYIYLSKQKKKSIK